MMGLCEHVVSPITRRQWVQKETPQKAGIDPLRSMTSEFMRRAPGGILPFGLFAQAGSSLPGR